MLAIEELAQELHEASRKAGEGVVRWDLLSELGRELRRNQARQLVRRLNVTKKPQPKVEESNGDTERPMDQGTSANQPDDSAI